MPQEAVQAATQEDTELRRTFRVGEEVAAMLEAFHPILEARLGMPLSRTRVAEWLIRRALEAQGQQP